MSNVKRVPRILQAEDLPTDEKQFVSRYEMDWSQVHATCPDWFRDAKFGLFYHWGPYSVPQHANEWYSRNIYIKGSEPNEYHTKTYGNVSEFGYKDFIDQFTGECFDADAWAELTVRSGARYAAAVAEHADGFSMWDSAVNRFNAAACGPRQDIVGALKQATERHGLKFGATLHHAWLWGWYGSSDPNADVYDHRYWDFYGKPLPFSATKYIAIPFPDEEFCQNWLDKNKEIVDKYLPDMIYFDSRACIVAENYRLEFLEYYYEAAQRAGKQVVVTYKQEDFHEGCAIRDVECSRYEDITDFPWQTDDKTDWYSWCHVESPHYKRPETLIHQLVDVVSKNGNLLLNAAPKADGTFPSGVVRLLEEIGDWLSVNGEAIYGSRPYTTAGEGPTPPPQGNVRHDHQLQPYTAEDIRFSQKSSTLYAILLGWPYAGKANIATLRRGGPHSRPVHRITLLGHDDALLFIQDDTTLSVVLPKERPCKHAYVLKIE